MPEPDFTDWGSPRSAGQIPADWLQQIYAYLIQHPLPVNVSQIAGFNAASVVNGSVNADGTKADDGGNFTSDRARLGTYTITFPTGTFSAAPRVVANTTDGSNSAATAQAVTADTFTIKIHDSSSGALNDHPFDFLAQAPST